MEMHQTLQWYNPKKCYDIHSTETDFKLPIDGSNLTQFRRDRPKFQPCISRLIVPELIDRLTWVQPACRFFHATSNSNDCVFFWLGRIPPSGERHWLRARESHINTISRAIFFPATHGIAWSMTGFRKVGEFRFYFSFYWQKLKKNVDWLLKST